jgi:hypothetical protein
MSARARLVEVVCRQEKTCDVPVGTTMVEDKVCAPQLEAAVAVVLGLLPDQINITVTHVTQKEVDLHFGVYERMVREAGCGTADPMIDPAARRPAGAGSWLLSASADPAAPIAEWEPSP